MTLLIQRHCTAVVAGERMLTAPTFWFNKKAAKNHGNPNAPQDPNRPSSTTHPQTLPRTDGWNYRTTDKRADPSMARQKMQVGVGLMEEQRKCWLRGGESRDALVDEYTRARMYVPLVRVYCCCTCTPGNPRCRVSRICTVGQLCLRLPYMAHTWQTCAEDLSNSTSRPREKCGSSCSSFFVLQYIIHPPEICVG